MRKETEDGILADLITRNRPSLLVHTFGGARINRIGGSALGRSVHIYKIINQQLCLNMSDVEGIINPSASPASLPRLKERALTGK
jgi:hypothetical protein